MAGSHQRVPDFLTRLARSDLGKGYDQIKTEDAPDANVDGNIHGHVTFAIGNENSQVLEENRELDTEKGRTINN